MPSVYFVIRSCSTMTMRSSRPLTAESYLNSRPSEFYLTGIKELFDTYSLVLRVIMLNNYTKILLVSFVHHIELQNFLNAPRSSSCEPHLRATGRHLPYGITQCYLPPDTSEGIPPNPSHAGWYSIYLPRRDGRLSWPSWLDSAQPGVEPATFQLRVRRRTAAPKRQSVLSKTVISNEVTGCDVSHLLIQYRSSCIVNCWDGYVIKPASH